MIESTSKFEVREVIFNKEGFAIATGHWNGDRTKITLACRWHENGGIGYPQTFGKPQWMVLPGDVTVDIANATNPADSQVVVRFN